MGANLDYRIMADEPIQMQQKFDMLAQQSRYENGNQYSGCIGMLHGRIDWRPELFASQRDAFDYLADEHEKWDGPMAVSYRDEETNKIRWIVGGWCSS